LRGVIHDYKYRGHAGWARVFARLLLGWLDAHASHDPPDLIVANPGFAPDGQLGHTERVLAVARRLDATHRWPIDPLHPPALVKTAPTARSAAAEAADKLAIADAHRRQLRIPTPHRVRGRRIVVFDDVATTGFQLDAVAACLLDDGGALEVRGLVIGRAPW
jgi:predicted amidophosphoribosyltransferase